MKRTCGWGLGPRSVCVCVCVCGCPAPSPVCKLDTRLLASLPYLSNTWP